MRGRGAPCKVRRGREEGRCCDYSWSEQALPHTVNPVPLPPGRGPPLCVPGGRGPEGAEGDHERGKGDPTWGHTGLIPGGHMSPFRCILAPASRALPWHPPGPPQALLFPTLRLSTISLTSGWRVWSECWLPSGKSPAWHCTPGHRGVTDGPHKQRQVPERVTYRLGDSMSSRPWCETPTTQASFLCTHTDFGGSPSSPTRVHLGLDLVLLAVHTVFFIRKKKKNQLTSLSCS